MSDEVKLSSEFLEKNNVVLEESDNDDKEPNLFIETIKLMIIALAIVLPIRMFVVAPFIVDGDSMTPNYHNGEYLLVDEISYRFQQPQRGDVVVFHPPDTPSVFYIKRIIGLPGDTVELKNGKITISNAQTPEGYFLSESEYLSGDSAALAEFSKGTLKENEYYVLGDNRNNSRDSRRIGPITNEHIKGKVILRVFPFKAFTFIQRPEYLKLNTAVNN